MVNREVRISTKMAYDGTEDLVLHGWAAIKRSAIHSIVENSWLDVLISLISTTSRVNLIARLVNNAVQTLPSRGVHNATKILRFLRVLAKHLVQLSLAQGKKLVGDGSVHQAVVRANTSLARVDKRSPDQALSGQIKIRIFGDDARALSS